MNEWQFAGSVAYFDVPDDVLEQPKESRNEWLQSVAVALHNSQVGIVLKIGKLCLGAPKSRQAAHLVAEEICQTLQEQVGLPSLYVEYDRRRPVNVGSFQTRTLLPHHDGAHCSYLSPSLLDYSDWNPSHRVFSNAIYSTTHVHKLYQGFFIVEPGNGLSVTTYYPWLRVLQDAFVYANHKSPSLHELQQWLGMNIDAALALQTLHKCRYLTLGAALGSQTLLHQGISLHWAEEEFLPAELDVFPQLRDYGSVGRLPRIQLLDEVLQETLGLTWSMFCEKYQVSVVSERHDLLLGHNIFLVHGGFMGGPTRWLEPMCLVVDEAHGDHYERWLSATWKLFGAYAR